MDSEPGAVWGRRAHWPWFSLLPLGLGAWVVLVAGVRCRVRVWTALGVLWSVLALVGWVLAGGAVSVASVEEVGVWSLLLAWVGSAVTSFAIRPAYKRRMGGVVGDRVPWPEPTARSRDWSVRYALTAYVVTLVTVAASAAVLYFGLGVRPQVGVGVLIVDAILLGSLVPLKRKCGLTREDLGLRAVPGARSVGLVVLAVIAYLLVAVVWVAVVRPTNAANSLADVRNQSTIDVVFSVLAIAVSAPVVEEVFFRGLLYRSLRNRLAVWPAALLVGAMFGFVHITGYPLDTLPVKAAFGVIACLLYERTGSLLPGIALHSLVDASGVDFALTGNDLIVATIFSTLAVVLIGRAAVRRLAGRSRRVQQTEIPQTPI